MKELIRKILREQDLIGPNDPMHPRGDNYDGIPNMDGIPNNEPVSFNKSEIRKKINNLRAFLHSDNGLGLKKLVNDIQDEIKSPMSNEEKENSKEWLLKLKNANKINSWYYNKLLEELENFKRVEVNGRWHHSNKINTNYTLLSELVTDILFEQGRNDILQQISEENNPTRLKDILKKYKNDIQDEFGNMFDGHNLIDIADKKLGVTDRIGLATENKAVKWIESDKWGGTVVRQGGDGDFIDMKLGIDLIVEFKGKLYTVQVKTGVGQKEDFIKRYLNGSYKSVDILMYLDKGKIKPINLKKLKK